MDYTFAAITTVADCDALLAAADTDQRALNYKKMQQERAYEISTLGSFGVDAQLAAAVSEITGLETAVASLPEGPSKQALVDRLVAVQNKKYLLERRRRGYSTPALIQKQYAITGIEKLLAENISYADAVRQRKTDLARG